MNKEQYFLALIASFSSFISLIQMANFLLGQSILPAIFLVSRFNLHLFQPTIDKIILVCLSIVLSITLHKIEFNNKIRHLGKLNSIISIIGLIMILIDFIIVFESIILIISFINVLILIYFYYTKRFYEYLNSFFTGIFVSIQLSSLLYYLIKSFFDLPNYSIGALVEYHLFMTPLSLTKIFLTLFLFSWIWIPLLLNFTDPDKYFGSEKDIYHKLTVKKKGLFVILFLFISFFVGYYPYLGLESKKVVGIDTPRYYRYIKEVKERGINTRYDSGRFFHIFYVIVLQSLTSDELGLRLSFGFNALLIFITTYILFSYNKSEFMRVFASVLSIFSITNVVGGTIGLLSNWFTLSLWYLFFVALHIYLVNGSTLAYFFTYLASVLIIFTHVWTWSILMLIVLIYQLYSLFYRKNELRDALPIFIFLGINALLRYFLFAFVLSPYEPVASTESTLIANLFNPVLLFSFIKNVSVLTSLSAQYTNFLIPLLCIFGMLKIVNRKNTFDRIVIAWLIVCTLGFYASNVSDFGAWMPQSHAWRFLFLIPYQIPAAEGLLLLLSKVKGRLIPGCEYDKYVFLRYSALVLAAPFFFLLGNWELLIIPFSLLLTFIQIYKNKPSIKLDFTITILLALVNYTLRGLTAGSIFTII